MNTTKGQRSSTVILSDYIRQIIVSGKVVTITYQSNDFMNHHFDSDADADNYLSLLREGLTKSGVLSVTV